MNTALKMGGFAVGLLAIFGVAVGVGVAVTPADSVAADSVATDSPTAPPAGPGDGGMAEMAGAAESAGAPAMPAGLLVSQDGYRLQLAERMAPAGPQAPLSFQILGPDEAPVTEYRTEHDKDLHLIVVRHDLTGFQHIHPVLDPGGTWRVPADLTAAGEYRVFADFSPVGHDGGLVLGADLAVAGQYQPASLPAPAATTE